LLRRAQDLGPEAAIYNLTHRTYGQADTLAALPTAGAARLRDTLEQQVRGAQPRVQAGLEQVFGPGQTRAQQQVEQQLVRGGQAEIYQQNRPALIDPVPVRATIATQLAEHPRGTAPHTELRRLDNILTDPGMPDNASKLLAMRGHIRTRIEAAGVARGADEFSAFEEGSRTPTGHALMPVYREINTALPAPIRQSDAILANAADVTTAGQIGGTQIFGRGAKMDPVELERRYGVASTASPAERAALLARTRQAGAHMLGETQAEANVGRATTNAIASQNVLDRVRAIAGPEAAQQLQQLAMRENVIGGQAGRLMYGSPTAQRLRGGRDVPVPGDRTMGKGNVVGAVIGSTGDISQATGGLAGAVLEGALKKILNAPMKRRDTAVSDAMADILRQTGGNRDAALMRLYAIRPHLPHTSRVLLGVNALINGLTQSNQPSQGLLQ